MNQTTMQILTEFPVIAGVDMPIKCRKLDISFPIMIDFSNLTEEGFSIYSNDPMANAVHLLDKSIMINEAIEHMPNAEFWNSLGEKVDERLLRESGVELEPWTPEEAFRAYMATASLLKLI